MSNLVWPDILIAAIVLVAALKGLKRGFISELSGAIALFLSLVTPWYYNGAFDGELSSAMHLGPGSAHVVGMFLTAAATYALIVLLAWALNRFAKLPFLGTGNAVAGAAVGIVKAAVGLWVLLYVVLFFPLSPDIRADLHRSQLVHVFTTNDDRVDASINATLPWFVRLLTHPFFARHHA